jgi:hypothetical protein
VRFTRTGPNISVILSHGTVIYATGFAVQSRTTTHLWLTPIRGIRPGHYLLTLGRGRHPRRERITIR